MTTFLSHSPTVNGYSFNSSFWLPSLGPIYNYRPTPDFVDSLTTTPENIYYLSSEYYLHQYENFENQITTTKVVNYNGHSLYMGDPDTAYKYIPFGYITDMYVSFTENCNYSITGDNLNLYSFESEGFSIFGINFDATEIREAYEVDHGAWRLITRGDDFFDATIPTSIIQSDIIPPYTVWAYRPYWAQEIHAGPGNDTILASPGRDYLIGGIGGNAIRAGAGQDVIYAGDNVEQPLQDIWSVAYGEADLDYVWAGWGSNAWLDGGSGDDVLWDGLGRDVLIGGAGNDTLVAENGANYIMVFAEDVRAGEIDTVYSFTTADNYLQLPAAWDGKVGTYFDGSSTFLVLPTEGGDFYVQVWGVAPPDVWSHVYFA